MKKHLIWMLFLGCTAFAQDIRFSALSTRDFNFKLTSYSQYPEGALAFYDLETTQKNAIRLQGTIQIYVKPYSRMIEAISIDLRNTFISGDIEYSEGQDVTQLQTIFITRLARFCFGAAVPFDKAFNDLYLHTTETHAALNDLIRKNHPDPKKALRFEVMLEKKQELSGISVEIWTHEGGVNIYLYRNSNTIKRHCLIPENAKSFQWNPEDAVP